MKTSQEKPKEEGVHLVYKKLGETPLEALKSFQKENPEVTGSLTYAGRLDPMAEGLLVLLSDDKVYKKEEYTDLPKVYEFEVLWGFETDTLDILGIVNSEKVIGSSEIPKKEKIEKFLKESVGKFEQTYPIYSSRPVNGKPLLEWAREGRILEIDIPKHEVEIFSSKFFERRELSKKELEKEIIKRVNLVSGDFRQEEIIKKWKEVLKESKGDFVLDKIEVFVSGGFYVRQFVNDLAENFNTKATTFHIKRTKIGEYSIA